MIVSGTFLCNAPAGARNNPLHKGYTLVDTQIVMRAPNNDTSTFFVNVTGVREIIDGIDDAVD